MKEKKYGYKDGGSTNIGNEMARRELREGGKAMKGSQPSYKHGEMPKCMPK
jgi:hypothetical protein